MKLIEMKIAQVCHRYHPQIGGVETHVKEISERLIKLGHEIEVITTDPTGDLPETEIINGVKIRRFRSIAPGEAYYFAPKIYFYLKANQYDIVHAHNYHAFPALFAALAKGNNRKFVFTPHYHRNSNTLFRNLLHKPYKFLGKILFSLADYVICVSEYEKRLIESDFKVADKTVKIPNGIKLKEFENLKRQQKGNGEKILLYVGRLEEYKGVQYIIQSLPELQDFRLRVVGKGPYEEDLRIMAKNLGVDERVEWLKNLSREELLECYASADVFLMLSSHEAYGITVAEALAAGTPCVVAKGSALEEFVEGENCVGIESPIISSKVSEAIKMLEGDKQRISFSKKQVLMDWNEVVEKIESLFSQSR